MKNIIKTIDLPDGRAVLLDTTNESFRLENLVRLSADGAVRWWAVLPANAGLDSFVDMALDGDYIRAVTWSGWAMWFDRATGTVNKSVFIK
jgi:hypothetical protein